MDVWKIVSAIKQRWLLFLICFSLAVIAAVMIPRQAQEPVYVSVAKVLLTPPSTFDAREMTRWWFTDEATLKELVRSEHLLRRVIERLKLKDDWTDLKKGVELASGGTTSYRMSAGLFQISVEADNPQKSQEIAEALVEEFVIYIQDLSAQEFANTRAFLENLVAEAHGKVEETQNKLLSVSSSRELAADERDVQQSQGELEAERLKLREELTTAEAEVRGVSDFVAGHSTIAPWSILKEEGTTSRELEQAVSTRRVRVEELSEIYRPDSPILQEQQRQFEHIDSLYQTQLKDASSALLREKNTQVAELKSRLVQVEARLADIRTKKLTPAEKREVAKLEQQLKVWEESRLDLVRQLYQARVSEQASRRQGAISILERPTLGIVPKEKRLPSIIRSLAVGIPFGLLFGFSMVVLVEFLSTSLRLLPRIEETLELPILAVIPMIPPEMAEQWEKFKSRAGSKSESESSEVGAKR